MSEEIYIYADAWDKKSVEHTGELVHIVKNSEITLPMTVFTLASTKEAEKFSFDTVSVLSIESQVEEWEDDAAADVLAGVLKEKKPHYILIPATAKARSVFARVAAILGIGMTADCTELFAKEGKLLAKKPAFGNFTMVTLHNEGEMGIYSVMMGRVAAEEAGTAKEVVTIEAPRHDSRITLTQWDEEKANGVISAEHIISVGKGMASAEAMADITTLAERLNMAIGGTRPLVDNGMLPFESQIGQTGFTVHPKSCLFLGVSGAVQHTEGVRDTQIMIAVNTDASAPIFHFANYGVVADAHEIVKAMLKITEECHGK